MSNRAQTDHIWDSSGQITSSGSANAYVIATAEPITGYYQGMPPIRFKANFGNTGSATANINGLGAVTLKKGGGATDLASGDIVSGGVYTLSHDGTNFQVLELNSPAVTSVGGFPLSASGDRWGVLPVVGTDGVMEIGQSIDFHNSDGDTTDNANRLDTNGGTVGLYETPSGGVLKRIVSAIDSTLAQGDILYFDGTNFVRLAPGTSGQFLQTLGAAATPQWASALPLLAFGSVSAAATLDLVLTAYTAYRGIKLFLCNFLPATDGQALNLRTSTNGGSSYDAGASDYASSSIRYGTGAAVGLTGSAGTTAIAIATSTNNVGNASNEGANAEITLLGQANTAFYTRVSVKAEQFDTATLFTTCVGGGARLAAADVDAIRVMFASGNIASGTYALFGIP